MAKVFTITEGLENLGALKSGGQGSVYKARRTGELVSAVKILPTPISSESEADKHFISFRNEVEKLKRVNEVPNPNVISILASGITSSGNLPFIEMEYIDGPDLGELLTGTHDAVFTIKEIMKVADHLSNALAHCHRAGVKHGDIKSNNVKFNRRTGNYMLLDFGLSVMSDEHRRTSMRYAGAIEFMAPEQSAGETLFETDVYSFGIILFELLAGRVPFPLSGKGEMGRNAVMVAHMESPVPDPLLLRREALPVAWSMEKQEREMRVPGWMKELVNTCLEKTPSKRFRNGEALQDFIHEGMFAEENRNLLQVAPAIVVHGPVDDSLWKEQVQQLQALVEKNEHLVNDLRYQVEARDRELYQLNMELYNQPKRGSISRTTFFMVLMLALALTGYALYDVVIQPYQKNDAGNTAKKNSNKSPADSSFSLQTRAKKKIPARIKKKAVAPAGQENMLPGVQVTGMNDAPGSQQDLAAGHSYRIKRNAFFYAEPNRQTRDHYYVNNTSAVLTSLREQADFIYVELTDSKGKITHTWLAREDLAPVEVH